MITVEFCIVGLGPAGLGAALTAARSKHARNTLCIESGVEASLRSCAILQNQNCRWSNPCSIVAGVGGAALMSSGKVSGHPAGRALRGLMLEPAAAEFRLDEALEEFQRYVPIRKHNQTSSERRAAEAYYAAKGFTFRYYPAHRFANADIVTGVSKMMEVILNAGIPIRTETRVTDIRRVDGGYELATHTRQGHDVVRAKRVLLATGRSGYELVSRLLGTELLTQEIGPIDLGVRMEFPSDLWPDIDAHHNDLKLHFRNARTFCVCKGGSLAPYRVGNVFLMEGYSDPAVQTAFSNLAVTARLHSPDFSPQIFEAIRRRLLTINGGWPVAQTLLSFMEEDDLSSALPPFSCSIKHWRVGKIRRCFDDDTNREIRHAVNAVASAFIERSKWKDVSLFAPEVDFYWPKLRLRRGFSTDSPGLFVAGDAAGHFRGILQAFLTGGEVAAQAIEVTRD